MKKNKTLLVIAAALLAISSYFIFTKTNGTIKRELRDFAVADTTAITKIFMADKTGKTAVLERKGPGEWTVNQKYPARQDAINTLLYTMKAIEVRSPAGKAAYNNVMKELSTSATKVEIYNGDNKIKTYYVGSPTQDMLGTFMYLENSTAPFINHIPGFNGFLSTRYFTDEREWRSQFIFAYGENTIKKVVAHNNVEPANSFRIERKGDSYQYFTPDTASVPTEIYQSQLIAYLAKYQMVGFERTTYGMKKHDHDSITNSNPIRVLEVEGMNGRKDKIIMYRKPVAEGTLTALDPETGKLRDYDYDRMYAQWNNDEEFVVVQYFVFDKLFNKPDAIKGFGGI